MMSRSCDKLQKAAAPIFCMGIWQQGSRYAIRQMVSPTTETRGFGGQESESVCRFVQNRNWNV